MKTRFAVKTLLAAALAACALSFSAGASAQQAHAPYSVYTTPSITIRVHWSTARELEEQCGKGAAGCTAPANAQKPYAEIWAQKPTGWDDQDLICYLGGIVLRVVDSGTARTNTAQLENGAASLESVLR
jgi:hypothetical protein